VTGDGKAELVRRVAAVAMQQAALVSSRLPNAASHFKLEG